MEVIMERIQWIFKDGGYFYETVTKLSPKYSITNTHEIWEYSKNCWVCTDRSILTNDEPRNIRGFLPSAKDVMNMEQELNDIIDELLMEIK